LGAVLARKKEKRFEEVIVLLNESTDSHFKELQVCNHHGTLFELIWCCERGRNITHPPPPHPNPH
jgi:hypothetical protein